MVSNVSFHITRGLKQNEPYIDTACSSLGCRYITRWANGEVGAIVKLNDDNKMYFVDYLYDPGHGDIFEDIRQIHKMGEEEEAACPIVAFGIVAYWLFERLDDKSTSQIFEEYYKMEESKYLEDHKKSLDAWKRDLKSEFCGYHLKQERSLIDMSETISPYLNSEDVELIKQLGANYLEFIQSQDEKAKNDFIKIVPQSLYARHEDIDELFPENNGTTDSKTTEDNLTGVKANKKTNNTFPNYDPETETWYPYGMERADNKKKSEKKGTGRPKAKPFEDYIKKDAPEVFLPVLEGMMEGKKGKAAALIIVACNGYWIDKPENKSVIVKFPSVKSSAFNTAMRNPSQFSSEEIEEVRKEIKKKLLKK